MPDSAPNTTDGNPFSLLAYVLFQVRHGLEDYEQPGRPPRWVRIARGARHKGATLGSFVGDAVKGIAESLSAMAELTLDLEELLDQTDAAKAIVETMLKLIQAATDKNFQDGIMTLTGVGSLGSGVTTANTAAIELNKYLAYIPEPEDVRGLGHELYRMLCITQLRFPRNPDNTINSATPTPPATNPLLGPSHVNIDETGKIRLCAWAYAHGVTTWGLGAGEANNKELFTLGGRRLFATNLNSGLPQKAALTYVDGDNQIGIYDFDFASANPNKKATDIAELMELLKKHGYNAPVMDPATDTIDATIRHNLMKFQAINELPITGEVDNDTLNRLMNLDFAQKNLRRAQPFVQDFAYPWVDLPSRQISGILELINPSADQFVDEGLALVPTTPHPYYVVPITPAGVAPGSIDNWPAPKQGWLSDTTTNVRGFVGLRTRTRQTVGGVPGRYVGGIYSEGESATGSFFFAARLVTPWIDGRHGAPPPYPGVAIFPEIPAGITPAISRMYQWVPLPPYLSQAENALSSSTPDGSIDWDLFVYASVLQRALFTNRDTSGYPDRGLIQVKVYKANGFVNGTMSYPYDEVDDVAVPNAKTELYPDHAATTAGLQLADVDRKRYWVHRQTARVQVPVDAVAICLVAEGHFQVGHDIDAYFDNFALHYEWRKQP